MHSLEKIKTVIRKKNGSLPHEEEQSFDMMNFDLIIEEK